MSIQARPRQQIFIDKSFDALTQHGNTLSIAPTGAGKTVCATKVVEKIVKHFRGGHHLFLQHRDELVEQNSNTLFKSDPKVGIGFYTADKKRYAKGGVTFAMIQTLGQATNLALMPELQSITVDEAHHSAADSYIRVFEQAKKLNPKVMIFGVTATPNRGDKKTLKIVFDNVADQITIGELVATGFLVPPRGFAIDVGVTGALEKLDEEAKRRHWSENELLTAADKLMNKSPITDKVIEEWKARAGNRPTVVFCSTVEHARNVADAFCAAGVRAGLIDGTMPKGERKAVLKAYDRGELQVITNVAVLTEGWDHQPTSCVILLRPSSYKSTMMQMVGRGLRTVDPERYPGVIKDDCIILDFGTSLLRYQNLETNTSLEGEGCKTCPECQCTIPTQCNECPLCGYEFPREEVEIDEAEEGAPVREKKAKAEIGTFIMRELGDLLKSSPYRWENFFNGVVMIADAIDAWAMIVYFAGRWHALGGARSAGVTHIADNADQVVALAIADDYLRAQGDADTAGKTSRWLTMAPSDKQLELLGLTTMDAMTMGISRYRASCELTWKFNQAAVKSKLQAGQAKAAISARGHAA